MEIIDLVKYFFGKNSNLDYFLIDSSKKKSRYLIMKVSLELFGV